MKTGTFLDLDMSSLGGILQNGFRWWIDELSGLLPAKFRRRARPITGQIFDAGEDGEFFTDGDLHLGGSNGPPIAATILLPADMVLIRDVALPALRLPDLRKLVALDLDRLMPFPADSAYADVVIDDSGKAAPQGKLPSRVAAISKAKLNNVYQSALGNGLAPKAIGIANDGRKGLVFDFLTSLQEEGIAQPQSTGRYRWWALVALLFAANLGLLIWKDVQAVKQIQQLVDAQQPLVEASGKLSKRLVAENSTRSELMAIRQRDNALEALAFVSRSLPEGAWVQRYSWNGQTLKISGYKQEQQDVLKALRQTGKFSAVRASISDGSVASANGQPFEISADWKAK